MTFYKIIDFKFMGRSFTAFRNELGFQTFLEYVEINKERKYHYVDDVTYKKLYNMFAKKNACFYDDGDNKKNKKKFRFTPKILSTVGAAVLAVSLTACSTGVSDKNIWPSDLFDKNEVIITDDYELYEIVKQVNLLTTDGMELYWQNDNVTFDDVRLAIEKNNNIDDMVREYLYDFVNKIEENLPNVNLGCFYHNVKDLKVSVENDYGMMAMVGSSTALACFVATEDTIYYNPDKLDEDNFKYVMYHEIGHMLLNGHKKVKGYDTDRSYTSASNAGYMLEEGFDTLFIEDVVGVELADVSYRLPANYVKILMEAVDYTLEDYTNGNHVDFESRIKEYLNDDSYDVDNLPFLVEYQKYALRQNRGVEMEDSEFHDLYVVVAGAYFKSNIEFCTSKEAIVSLYNELLAQVLDGVHGREEDYTFDFTGLKDGMEQMLDLQGIDKSIWPDDNDLDLSATVPSAINLGLTK